MICFWLQSDPRCFLKIDIVRTIFKIFFGLKRDEDLYLCFMYDFYVLLDGPGLIFSHT